MNYLNKAINSYNIPNLLLFGKDIGTIDMYLKDVLNSKFKIISNKDTRIKDINYKYNNVYYEFNMKNIYKNDNFIEVINDIIICKDYYSDLSYKIIILNQFNDIKVSLQNILRVTIEKFRITTVFIIITNNYSNIIEPLKSRCLMVRVPLPNKYQIFNIVLKISNLENIDVNINDFNNILENCDSNISKIIWYLELKKHNMSNIIDWKVIVKKITNLILIKINSSNELSNLIKKCREYIYILFITNLNLKLVIRYIMKLLISNINDNKIKYNIINITSEFELRMNKGTRQIIHLEAYILKILQLLYK